VEGRPGPRPSTAEASAAQRKRQRHSGSVVVAPHRSRGTALFYTTVDFEGRLDPPTVGQITTFIEDRFGIEASLTTCLQVHGATVQPAGPSHPASAAWRECDSCDALWSREIGTALGIKVADCLPVSIVDSEASVLANIHSGWRGTVRRILPVTLDAVSADSSFSVDRAHAFLGPAIRQCCFEVGEEVVAEFQRAFGDVTPFVDRSRPRPHIDVAGLTRSLLTARGFTEDHIHDSGLCTRCDGSLFHSYRRGGKNAGRNLAIVAQ
jgi:YfiH family protein